jgi:hypothetical protein
MWPTEIMATGIALTAAAYAEIRELLPRAGSRPPEEVGGLYLVSLPNDTVDTLIALRRPSESFSDVIIRLAAERG